MVTDEEHLRQCVKVLNEKIQNREIDLKSQRLGYEAVFELIDLDWTEVEPGAEAYVDGYTQCMLDFAEAIAQEWGVELPERIR